MNKNEKNNESDQAGFIQLNQGRGTVLPTRMKTMKVEIRTWDSLKSRKKENETFNDVIKELLNERTVSIGNDNVKAIKYKRKICFFTTIYNRTIVDFDSIAFEFEYNDIKGNKSDFMLDVKIRTVFFRKKRYNPSVFFGTDNVHKHYSGFFLYSYLKAVALALRNEFKIQFIRDMGEYEGYDNIAKWRQLYYDYNLSEESFINDIEDPLRLSEEEKPPKAWQINIKNSIVEKLMAKKNKQ